MDLALSRLLAHMCGWRLLEQNGYLPIFWEPWVLTVERADALRIGAIQKIHYLGEFWPLWQGRGCSAF